MSYYLDSNAWIHLSELPDVGSCISNAALNGSIKISLSRENMYELVENPEIPEERRLANEAMLSGFDLPTKADSIFILGRGILGETVLATTESEALLNGHLKNKGNPLKAVPDGVHLVNAKALGATLVSCDRQTRSTAKSEKLDLLCLNQFLALPIFSLPKTTVCISCF